MDAVFPASNRLGIPDLDPAQQPDCLHLPVWAWGSVGRSRRHNGTWHCYVEDGRFARLVREPDALVATGCAAAVEPNISVFDDTPPALAHATIYRKRWVARYWQTCGVKVWVDLNLPARLLDGDEWAMGIPPGWRAFATRGYDRRVSDLDREYAAARSIAERPLFLVVGGGRQVADWCGGRPGVLHSCYRADRRVYRDGQG